MPPPTAYAWLALVGLGLGPVGAAFLLWDIGMKGGNVPLLGVLSYASPILSTGAVGAVAVSPQPTWSLALACALMVLAAVIATRASAEASPERRARDAPGPCADAGAALASRTAAARSMPDSDQRRLCRRVAAAAPACLLLLQPLGQQESQLQRLAGVEARIAARVVLAGQIGLRDLGRAARALRHVLAGHLDVHAAGIACPRRGGCRRSCSTSLTMLSNGRVL